MCYKEQNPKFRLFTNPSTFDKIYRGNHHGANDFKIVPYAEDPEEALKTLRNTVIKYTDPTEPVGVEDWEALK